MPSGLDRLHDLPRFTGEADDSFKPGLERMHALLDAMGRPERSYPSIHVAGTNGKGSTASLAASILSAAGPTVGLHTSPELLHVTERMRVDGVAGPEEWLDEAVRRHADALDRTAPSFFEATVAFSFLYFAEASVDIAVVEVGLGGRLDATNVLQPLVSIITTIDLEHTNLLGTTLPAIAREKAGIIKPNTPCVTGVTQPEALSTIREIASAHQAPLHVLEDEGDLSLRDNGSSMRQGLDLRTPSRAYEALQPALPGRHQHRNAWLATRAVEIAYPDVTTSDVRDGLQSVARRAGLRGRMDILSDRPLIIADVAHNASSLAATLHALLPSVRGHLRVGLALARDKDAEPIAKVLADRGAAVVPLRVVASRLHDPADLAAFLRRRGVRLLPPQTVEGARRHFEQQADAGDALLLTGSHHVVRDALRPSEPVPRRSD
ncbi:bifunctional folylpolyglutamate synthase/dihydrofolate synthase [Longibacter sp.]|uniref:bifunctional folylpolyglutamate synthase/dihydrofolate synthase n=1 Tax=Longibacter sp. TaxID=2045415 RepID=UPI003EB783E5